MRGMRVVYAAVIASLLGAGCAPTPTAVPKTGTKSTAKTGPLASPSPSTSPGTETTASPSPLPTTTTNLARDTYYGRVLGLDGKPAANVLVSGLIANNGSNLIGNNSGGLLGNNGSSFKVLQTGSVLQTRTDAEGYFELTHPNNQALNVEAQLQEDIKAIRMNVGADLKKFDLQLAYTGLITGKVTAPGRPEVTNFEGVRVYIPGTSYQATADAAGNFMLSNVPVGTFRLVADKTGLGVAVADTVTVKSKETTAAGELALKIDLPKVTAVSQPNAGAGTQLTLTGENFGASKGTTFSVAIGGVTCQTVERVDDKTIKATVPPGGGDNIVVTVDGIPSTAFPFKTIDKLRLIDLSAGEEDGADTATTRYELELGTDATFTIQALDKLGQPIASPAVTWESPTTTAFTFNNGTVSGKLKGRGEVIVRSGDQLARVAITVYDPEAEEIDPNVLIMSGGVLYAQTESDVYTWDDEAQEYTPLEVGNPDDEDGITAIAPAPGGGVYMAQGASLFKVTEDGTKTTVPTGNLGNITYMSATADGTIYAVVDYDTLKKLPAGSTNASVLASGLDNPEGMIVNAQGHVFLFSENTITKSTGATPAAYAKLPRDYYVSASAVDGTNLYVTDDTTVKKVAADGTVTNIPIGTNWPTSLFVADGKLYFTDGNDSNVVKSVTLP